MSRNPLKDLSDLTEMFIIKNTWISNCQAALKIINCPRKMGKQNFIAHRLLEQSKQASHLCVFQQQISWQTFNVAT